MTRAIIVEDEPKAARVLTQLIRAYLPDIGDLAVYHNGPEALEQLPAFKPQLVFLDVEMPGMDGFAFLEAAHDHPFAVIFTTAFDQYAIKAIRFSALDYLLKPIDPDELVLAYRRFQLSQENKVPARQHYHHLVSNLQSGDEKAFKLSISTTEGIHFLHPDEIIRCEADRNYTHFYQTDNRRTIASKPLTDFEQILEDQAFLRVHRSHLVNLQHIVRLHEGQLELTDGAVVPVSRRRRAEVTAILKRN